MEEHLNLVEQGTYLMLDRVLKDLQAEDEGMQSRALQALQSLAKGKRGGSKLPMQAIQAAFQQGKGLPRLVTLLDKVTTPRRSSTGQGKAIMAGAVDALAAMTRNNAAARREAIEAGAVPALCSVLGTGDDEPVSIEVLKALYTIIAPDSSGHTTTELFASGGVHALVRLLDNVLEYARDPQRSVWVREVLALLYPLVRRSRMVARLLASEMVGVCNVLQTVGDPLSLSLALDIMEEVLHSGGDPRKQGRRMARDGALAALVHAAHGKGMGPKAMLLLAGLTQEAELLHVLRSLLQPPDYACLVAIASRAAEAGDLDSQPCLQLLAALLSGPGVGGLRALTLGRCLHAALALSPIASDLFMRATSDTGLLALENLPSGAVAEATIAAALVLKHVPQAIAILLRPGALSALVDAALDEAASPAPDDSCGSEACHALSATVQWLPQDLPLSRQGTSTTELYHQPGLNNCAPQHSKMPMNAEHSSRLSSDTESANRAPSAQLESISEQEAHALHGIARENADAQQHTLENGHSNMAGHDSEQYETLTFHVGGKEFYALAWVMAGASRAIAQTLQQIPDTSTAAVVIPDVPSLPPSRMYEVFSLAAECVLDRERPVPPDEALDLWALAASLQMPEILRRCECVIASTALHDESGLERALSLTRGHRDSGASLRETCAKHVLEHLEDMHGTGHLPRLAKQHRSELRRGMTAYLRRQLVAAKPDPFRGSQVASSACGDSPRSARSLASSRPGALGLSRFSSLAEPERQSSALAASLASLDSPGPSRAASLAQLEVFARDSSTD